MSSTNHKNKIPLDHYATPTPVVKRLLQQLTLRPDDVFLEPCRAEGNIYNLIDLPMEQKPWAEIRMGVDYLKTEFNPVDVIVTNPPFSLSCEFIRKMLSELKPDGTLAFLQRVNFLGSEKRIPFWKEVGLPNKFSIITPRPSFTKGGNDSCEYAWFIYDRGNRFNIPHGLSHLYTKELLE